MDLIELQNRALEIRQKYASFEEGTYLRSWTNEEIALGFVGDVGDLAKLVIAMNGVRNIPEARQKLEHELADCMWCVLVLAHQFDVDLETAFFHAMDDLAIRISTPV